MSYMKRFLEDVSESMGLDGFITSEVCDEAGRRMKNPNDPCTKRAHERLAADLNTNEGMTDPESLPHHDYATEREARDWLEATTVSAYEHILTKPEMENP